MDKNANKNMYRRYRMLRGFSFIFSGITLPLFFIFLLTGQILGCLFLLIFFAAGGFVYKLALGEKKRVDFIVENGTNYTGVVADYVNDESMRINDRPLVALTVRYRDASGMIQERIVPTGDTTAKMKYPIGSCVDIIVDEGTKESILLGISENDVYDKALLVNADHEKSASVVVRREFVSCTCPKCGATLMIANHGTHKCEYCGSLISLDDFSKADDIYDVSVQGHIDKRRFVEIKPEDDDFDIPEFDEESDVVFSDADDIPVSDEIPDIVFEEADKKPRKKRRSMKI